MNAAEGPFRPVTVLLLALVGVFAFSALMVLGAYAPDLKSGDDGQAHALSKSAVGFAGLVEVLRLAGDPVVVNRGGLSSAGSGGLLVVTPPPGVGRKAVDALGFHGPVLVVLPKWETGQDFGHRGWVSRGGLLDPKVQGADSLMALAGIRRTPGLTSIRLRGAAADAPAVANPGPITNLQTMDAPGWTPLLVDQAGQTLLARAQDEPLYLLSDPDLLDTQGLKSRDTLGAALGLVGGLRRGDGPVIFDVRLNGLGRARGILRLLFDPPFLGVTLCLVAAAGLAAWQACFRFGPIRGGGRSIALGKAALVENTAALIRLAGREHRMGGRYADLVAELAARSAGAPRGLGGEALVAFLDRLGASKREPQSLSELAMQARAAVDAEDLTRVARKLNRWRLSMTRSPPGPIA